MLAASVLGRHIFYNGSKYDGGSTAINASDDLAVATDKSAYLAGSGSATFSNITSYARGINGIMIDVEDLAGAVSVADFTFQMSTQGSANNTPSLWEAAPAPSAISLRPGAGTSGSDRLEITWANGAIANRWLRVIFEGNDTLGSFNTNTGLNESDVFYFGNRIGDDGSGTPTLAVTSAIDELAARNNPGAGATVTNLYDFDRSGVVNATDAITARNNSGTLTKVNLAAPISIELTSVVPFTIDLTPQLRATTSSTAIMPNFTVLSLDVDLNNDGDFGDPGEVNYTSAMYYQGVSTFYVTPGLPAVPTNYDIKLRIRATGNDGLESISDTLDLEVDTDMSSALESYINTPDESYYYTLANTVTGSGYTFYVLDMTSQTWRSSDEVNMPDWRHWVEVVVPDGALAETALLYITGGNNNFGSPPSSPDSSMLSLALSTHTVTVRLRTVPSEPLIFADEGFSRSEDEIIAYSFDKFLEHIGEAGNDTWPVLVAMAKSAVRAMDTVQDFIPTVRIGEQIDDFLVTGYSKRGWTTWLTAAADDRVRAIIPGVIDVLNQGPQMVHHYNVYGFFSPAIHDYADMNIFERILTPEAQLLSQIVDPYRYLHNGRFDDMPKLLINSAGDEFFVSDSAQYYFSDIPGSDNYLRYLPNTGHSLDSRAAESTYSFYEAILNNRPLPEFSWTVSNDGLFILQEDTSDL
jgi:PhoPQ-activated pathogenicity-related protein